MNNVRPVDKFMKNAHWFIKNLFPNDINLCLNDFNIICYHALGILIENKNVIAATIIIDVTSHI